MAALTRRGLDLLAEVNALCDRREAEERKRAMEKKGIGHVLNEGHDVSTCPSCRGNDVARLMAASLALLELKAYAHTQSLAHHEKAKEIYNAGTDYEHDVALMNHRGRAAAYADMVVEIDKAIQRAKGAT